ncbi:MAG: XTP/dITP diphosphatase [Nitrospirota bacterium]
MEIVLATRNKKKIEEIRRMLGGLPIEIHSLDTIQDCPEVTEDQSTFEGNARKKAQAIAACTGIAALADDSGLEVDALHGAPGIHSARYAGTKETNDALNNEKLLSAMKEIPDGQRGARFVCCLALAFPDRHVQMFFGSVSGVITREPRGTNAFGYDPIFIPEGYTKTFAEMSSMEKDSLSHRGKALLAFKKYLESGVVTQV